MSQKEELKKKAKAVKQDRNVGVRSDREKELEIKLKKALADYQNLKRDMENRLQFEGELVKADVLRSIIDLADDIDIAVDHVEDEKGWREGVTLILEKFRVVIDDMGAEIIECKEGDVFDAKVHEAVGVVYEGEDGTIAKVIQNGYRFGDIIVRPARVIVNKINNKKK